MGEAQQAACIATHRLRDTDASLPQGSSTICMGAMHCQHKTYALPAHNLCIACTELMHRLHADLPITYTGLYAFAVHTLCFACAEACIGRHLPEEGSQGATLHVLSHDADDIGLCIRLNHHAVEAQHVGVVQVGQHFCLTPEGL